MNNTLLVVIVERDNEHTVFEALQKAGIRIFTRLQGTGTGVWQSVGRAVDPEKAVLMCVIPETRREAALDALRTYAKLDDDPGRGVGIAGAGPRARRGHDRAEGRDPGADGRAGRRDR